MSRRPAAPRCRSAGKRVTRLDAGAVDLLKGYGWPGNVRELENVIERAIIVARGDAITAADLDFGRRPGAPAPALAASPVPAATAGLPLTARLQEEERRSIIDAIERAHGNIASAARTLGINRSTLYYRLRKHDLEHLLPTKPAEDDGP